MPTKGCTKLGCENINLVSYNHSICKLISSSRKYGIVRAGEGVDLQYRCDKTVMSRWRYFQIDHIAIWCASVESNTLEMAVMQALLQYTWRRCKRDSSGAYPYLQRIRCKHNYIILLYSLFENNVTLTSQLLSHRWWKSTPLPLLAQRGRVYMRGRN